MKINIYLFIFIYNNRQLIRINYKKIFFIVKKSLIIIKIL